MNKEELFALEENAQKSLRTLLEEGQLIPAFQDRLQVRARRLAKERLTGASAEELDALESATFPLDDVEKPFHEVITDTLQELDIDIVVVADGDGQVNPPALGTQGSAGPGTLNPAGQTLGQVLAAADQMDGEAIQVVIEPAEAGQTVAEALQLEKPAAIHRDFQNDLDQARVFRLTVALGVDDSFAEKMIDDFGSIAAVNESRLRELVEADSGREAEMEVIGRAVSLFYILDERPNLVEAFGRGIDDIRELVKLSDIEWQEKVANSGTRPPDGISAADYAEILQRKVVNLFPTDALAHHLAQSEDGDVDTLSRRFPGMSLDASLGDGEISRRVGLVNDFFAQNRDVLERDLTSIGVDRSGLSFSTGDTAEQDMVLATARAYQRALAIGDDLADAEALVAGGFPSALSMVEAGAERLAEQTGLEIEKAEKYVARAKGIATGAAAHMGTLIDLVHGGFDDLRVNNVDEDVDGFLKRLPGFADLFGSQDYCTCRHCRSILGPAAYFADLMHLVEERVSKTYFPQNEDHQLKLRTRRPDLWSLLLSCENTHTEIPYLSIINEILENDVAGAAGFNGDFGDRPAIESLVYAETLPERMDSIHQPFHLAFEEIRTYLAHFERTLADLAEVGRAEGEARTRLLLELSPGDFQAITTAREDDLEQFYGQSFALENGLIKPFEAQELLRPLDVSRQELGELIATNYVTDNKPGVTGNNPSVIRIKGGRRDPLQSIQNDVEYISGLTHAALDRLRRFVRLWRSGAWGIQELDKTLDRLRLLELGEALDDTMLAGLGRIRRLSTLLGVDVGVIAELWTPGSLQPRPDQRFLHPVFASQTDDELDPNLVLLQELHTVSGTSYDEFYELVTGLAGHLGINLNSDDVEDKKFDLNEDNLTLINRHVRLSRILGITIPDLFALILLTPDISTARNQDDLEKAVINLDDLEKLVDQYRRWKETGRQLSELVELKDLTLEKILEKTPLPNDQAGSFVKEHDAHFYAGDDIIITIRRIDTLRKLIFSWTDQEEDPAVLLQALEVWFAQSEPQNPSPEILARALGCDLVLLQSLLSHLDLSSFEPLEKIHILAQAIELAQYLGVDGALFKLVRSDLYEALATASLTIQSGLRSKYEEEKTWQGKVEPFDDLLRSRRRDGLVAYLLHSTAEDKPYETTADLYHYLLLDVELEGCARTSKVAAAIASVQLYIERILMNLEQSTAGNRPVHIKPESIPSDEWEWRKNYRVWEANRKIFLHPENFIEPDLRDNKTPHFETLEEELLGDEITEETIIEAYGRYLRGFDEVSRLKIAGSYHEKDHDQRRDVLHLFGVTNDSPPIYYYRRVENAQYGVSDVDKATYWGPWTKIDLQIPVRKVAPVVFNGQLFLFWVWYVTKSFNKIIDGTSEFAGYQHLMHVDFSKRMVNGSWKTPQSLVLGTDPFLKHSGGLIEDPAVSTSTNEEDPQPFPVYDDEVHQEPRDGYTLSGFGWDQLCPEVRDGIHLRGRNFQMWSEIDLFGRSILPRSFGLTGHKVPNEIEVLSIAATLPNEVGKKAAKVLQQILEKFPARHVWSEIRGQDKVLHSTPRKAVPLFETCMLGSLILEASRFREYSKPLVPNANTAVPIPGLTQPQWSSYVTDELGTYLTANRIVVIPKKAQLDVVNGSVGDVIIQIENDIFYLQEKTFADGKYRQSRLNTSTSREIASILFNRGLDALLTTENQMALKETLSGLIHVDSEVIDETDDLDFDGPMGVYLREIFFHIPFLIANLLNSQGEYEKAQRWYHFIFDPTANDKLETTGRSVEEIRRLELDRSWRYREFRGLNVESLRDKLVNKVAVEAYRHDPFNPHAIARLRLSAYQKNIVMKYIDNLLDWGDHLFAQAFSRRNPELLGEARLRFGVAEQILGERPAQLGDCHEEETNSKTFAGIQDALKRPQSLLTELESFLGRTSGGNGHTDEGLAPFIPRTPDLIFRETTRLYHGLTPAEPGGIQRIVTEVMPRPALADTLALGDSPLALRRSQLTAPDIGLQILQPEVDWASQFDTSFMRQIGTGFCVPDNERLLSYWDRVEDRLFKLRNCLDIDGVARRLPLFAPPLDLDLLGHSRAAGLTIEEVFGPDEKVPPYRFQYLIEKAKYFSATVQSLGGSLLSALEKRDVEELIRIRELHQKNILTLTTQIRKQEIENATENLEVVNRQRDAAQYRFEYYNELLSDGRNILESSQIQSNRLATGFRAFEPTAWTIAGIQALLPQTGSPFAMKWGGVELHSYASGTAFFFKTLGDLAELSASISKTEAEFMRREQGWKHERELASHDLRKIERDLIVAELRVAIAGRSLTIHEKTQEQQDEIIEFLDGKFTDLGLYTYLSQSLQGIYRDAYGCALTLAKHAEAAYRFERPDETTTFVGREWDSNRYGLLAGERLLANLQRMEIGFINTDDRLQEINQSFSLVQIDPAALITLKETGSCKFSIPEFYFDLFYPGQYRRRIRAVRLTVPAVTGPYTNVSAKLTLEKSQIRREANLVDDLQVVPPSRTSTIATSSAQGDAGIFELNFRDERYLPFEGAGAISDWKLDLPKHFHPFDYQSISDVILTISYTAEDSPDLRGQVEDKLKEIEGSLADLLSDPKPTRVFSLRHEFPSEFNRLAQSNLETEVIFEITDRHFPLFLLGSTPQAASADVVLAVAKGEEADNLLVSLNNQESPAFVRDSDADSPKYGGLPFAKMDITQLFPNGLKSPHKIAVKSTGALATEGGDDASLIDTNKIRDILIVVEWSMESPI